jgi:hypothetical protein
MPVLRSLLHLAGSALLLSVGWAASGARTHVPASSPVLVAGPSEPAACADPLAMAANATLVGEVRDARRDLALAQERILASAPPAEVLPGRLQASPADWARRAADDNVILRVPCSRWDGAQSLTVHGVHRHSHMRRPGEAGRRADFLGLVSEERETLAQLYGRTQSRLWQSIRQVCEAEAEYREAVADANELEDVHRIAACRDALVVASDPATRRAYHEVMALRASGRAAEHLDGRARVIFALSGAPEILFDEMKRTFGSEAAVRLVDHGVTCFDESAYDLRSAEPGG